MTEIRENSLYCADVVRRQDHDRYLTALYAKPEKRDKLFALYAFNHEISKVREAASEPMLGEIRLQWWREAMDEIYQGAPSRKHEILAPLAAAITEEELPREMFMTLIDGRARDLYDDDPRDMAELTRYLEQTAGSVTCLAARILGDRDHDALAGRLGLAWGYAGIIRAVPYHMSLRKNFIPAALMREQGLEDARFLSPDAPEKMSAVIAPLVQEAERHLAHLKARKKQIAPDARSLYLLTALTRSYLKTIKKANYNPFRLEEKADAAFRHGRLLLAALFNRI